MNKYKRSTVINWTFFLLAYISFLAWHGNFSSSLSEDETNLYATELFKRNPERTIEEYKRLLANDTGNPIFMVNVIKYFQDRTKPGIENNYKKARELVKTYNNYVGKFLIQRGSYPIFLGKSTGETAAAWGVDEEDAKGWSEAAIVRYKNIRTMLELATDEEFNKNLDYKHAALEKTIIYPTESRIYLVKLEFLVFFILLSSALGVQHLITVKQNRNKISETR